MKPLFPEIIVNGTTIPAADIAAETQNHSAPQGKPGVAWQKAARALAVKQLLLEASEGIKAIPQEVAPGKIETLVEARIRALMDRKITPKEINAVDLRKIYDASPEKFRAPSLFEASHILWAVTPTDIEAVETATQHAEKVCERLQANPKKFGETAKAESTCSSRENGGFLGQLTSGDTVPEFEVAMAALTVGQISKPIQTRFGIHLIRLDAKAIGDVLPFSAVYGRLKEAAEMAEWTKAARTFTCSLIESAKITGVDLTKVT